MSSKFVSMKNNRLIHFSRRIFIEIFFGYLHLHQKFSSHKQLKPYIDNYKLYAQPIKLYSPYLYYVGTNKLSANIISEKVK